MGCLSISTLGSFIVSLDGRPVDSFEYNKIRALLTCLVVEADRPHRREALAGLLWPDQSQKAALDSLRNALSKLRQAIGDRETQPPYLFISKEEIQFNSASDHWLDVKRFSAIIGGVPHAPPPQDRVLRHLHRPADPGSSLYQGEFLQGFSLADSDLFEDWARLQRKSTLNWQ